MASQSAQKLLQLIEAVHEATLAGKLLWNMDADENQFQVSLAGYSFVIKRIAHRSVLAGLWSMPAVTYFYGAEIRSDDDFLIDEIREQDLAPVNNEALLREMYFVARRAVYGLDTAIDDMLESLRELNDDPSELPVAGESS